MKRWISLLLKYVTATEAHFLSPYEAMDFLTVEVC